MKLLTKRLGILFFAILFMAVAVVTGLIPKQTAFLPYSAGNSVTDTTRTTVNNNIADSQEKHEIKEYNKDNITDSKVTMRADIMKVTERNLPRPETKLLSDTFTLPGTDKSVTFPNYPSYINNVSIFDSYTATGYYTYYKYMLLRQGMYLINNSVEASLNGTLTQETLYKHPAVDAQYGEVPGTDNAVTKEITIDPIYRSLHTTGLYLPAGELINVKVSGLKTGEKINILTFSNSSLGYSSGLPADYFATTDQLVADGRFGEVVISSQWNKLNKRLPYMSANFQISKNGEYNIGTPFGGIIHLNVSGTYSNVKTVFKGAVETPHYILGVTTPEYFEEYLRNAPGAGSALDTENGILVGNADPFRAIEDIENMALLWHSFFSVNETFTGGPYNANNFVRFDVHVPAGAAVHLGGGVSVCPVDWYSGALNYQSLLNNGSWGVLHEIGHGNGSAYGQIWGLGGNQEGEVRNNALTVLAYIKFLDLGTSRQGEHGDFGHPYRILQNYMNAYITKTDYNEFDYFQALSTYGNLMHAFGVDRFYDLMHTYKDNAKYNDNKRADFIYRCSLVYDMDFRWYFNTMYRCGVDDAVFTQEQLDYISARKQYTPIASFYQGGLNGVKTSGDILVGAGANYTFDFAGKMLSPLEYEISEVRYSGAGSLVKQESGLYIYTAPSKGTGEEIKVIVKQSDGVITTINVYVRLNYNNAEVAVYNNIAAASAREIDKAVKYIDDNNIKPRYVLDKTMGISSFNEANTLRVARFLYKADKTELRRFYLKGDDAVRVSVSDDDKDYVQKSEIKSNTPNFSEELGFDMELQKGKIYYFKIQCLNFGGVAFAQLGLKRSNGTFYNASVTQIFTYGMSEEEIAVAENIKFEQKYYVSNKENMVIGALASNKNDWKVLTYPNHQDGNTYTEDIMEDGQVIATITKDKSNWLIDGFTSTIFHSVWRGGNRTPAPHVFIIDTNKMQAFNFFKISARHSADSLIKEYVLSISDDNVNYREISQGESLPYKNYTAQLDFPQVNGRYLKLEVKSTTGVNSDYFTIISEIDSGMTAKTERIIPVTSSSVYGTKGFVTNHTENYLPNDVMLTKSSNQIIKIAFKGDRISLYAATGKGYGHANIIIDGKPYGEINLDSTENLYKQLVFTAQDLENKTHIVEISTTSKEVFNLNFIGIAYDAILYNAQLLNQNASIGKDLGMTNALKLYLNSILYAPNPQAEINLGIALSIFVVLFVLLLAFLLLIYLCPPFRRLFLSSNLQLKLDVMHERNIIKRKQKLEERTKRKQEKLEMPKASELKNSKSKQSAQKDSGYIDINLKSSDNKTVLKASRQSPVAKTQERSSASKSGASKHIDAVPNANFKPRREAAPIDKNKHKP